MGFDNNSNVSSSSRGSSSSNNDNVDDDDDENDKKNNNYRTTAGISCCLSFWVKCFSVTRTEYGYTTEQDIMRKKLK